MSTTTLATRPAAHFPTVQIFRAALNIVKKVFQMATTSKLGVTAENEIWQLYRITGGADSVQPAVIKKLSQIAASE
jgi:hypothetical protein